jgi:pimeloyl-ACP methyl ester carboxylesterase
LVLLHGITGRGGDWAPVARLLAPHRRVIALDARGHGDSDWAPDAEYAGDAHFADVARALDELGLARCAIAGFSMGGGIAMLCAAAMPDRVERLVVIDAYPAPRMTAGSRRIAEIIARTWGGEAWPDRPPFDPAIARRMAEDLAAGSDGRLDLWTMWEAASCPALLVRGEYSDVLPDDLAVEMRARRAGARLVVAPEVGPRVPFARPEWLARHIAEFLAPLDAGAGVPHE